MKKRTSSKLVKALKGTDLYNEATKFVADKADKNAMRLAVDLFLNVKRGHENLSSVEEVYTPFFYHDDRKKSDWVVTMRVEGMEGLMVETGNGFFLGEEA